MSDTSTTENPAPTKPYWGPLLWLMMAIGIALVPAVVIELLLADISPMLVHSDTMSAFQLYAELDKTRTGRPAKGGDIAPVPLFLDNTVP